MRAPWVMFWVLALAVRAAAAPEPPPPRGFAGTQYIDGSSCVFLLEGGVWVPRTDRQGAPVCGFPPTLSQRGLAQDMPAPAPPPSIEDMLFRQLAAGLRDGEFAADPRPMEERREVAAPTGQSPVERDLQALIAGQDAMRGAMSGGPGGDLCRLLGYEPDPGGHVFGGDVTFGLCPGMRVQVPGPVITLGARHDASPELAANAAPDEAEGRADRKPQDVAASAGRSSGPPPAMPSPATLPAAIEAGDRPARTATRRPAKLSSPSEGAEMIAASARYIQIGDFADEASALAQARLLIGIGYDAGLARRPGDAPQARLLLVGPFEDRGALVRALNDLRGRGYDKAVAR